MLVNISLAKYDSLCILEAPVGGSCVAAASDSCSDPNAQCNGGTCECNAGYYDDDGISNNNAGTCTLRK